jgi:CelD/BcsL family acetyltransferase involved in cellulose biosynthesis
VKHDFIDICTAPEAIVPFLTFYEQKKEYKDPQLLVFLRAFANKSAENRWITVDTLSVDGQCIASLLHFVYGNKWLQYLMVTDKEFNPKVSVGDTIIGLVLEKAIAQGVGVYDFLKGTEDHKFRWANSANSSTNLLLGQQRPLPMAFMLGQLARNAAKVIVR